jgi:hypothetical protein
MNRTEITNLKIFYNFQFVSFSFGRVGMIASPSGKKKFKDHMRSKVWDFDGKAKYEIDKRLGTRVTFHQKGTLVL